MNIQFFAFCWTIELTLFALVFIKTTRQANKAIFYLSLLLLIYKTCEYAFFQLKGKREIWPVELSAITYFLFTITMVFKIKPLEQTAVFLSLISGSIYLISLITAGTKITYALSPYKITLAIISHSLLYFMAIVKLRFTEFKERKYLFNAGIIGILVLYSTIMNNIFDYSSYEIFIYKITDMSIASFIEKTTLSYGIYLFCITVLLFAAIRAFYFLSSKMYKDTKLY